MNIYISAAIRVSAIKFCGNVSYYCTHIKLI